MNNSLEHVKVALKTFLMITKVKFSIWLFCQDPWQITWLVCWNRIFSYLIFYLIFDQHSACSITLCNITLCLSSLTRYDKRQDLECQKSFHPFLSNFGLNWTSEITEFWCRINSSHQPASGNSIFYLTYTFKSAQSITNDFLTCQTKLFSLITSFDSCSIITSISFAI